MSQEATDMTISKTLPLAALALLIAAAPASPIPMPPRSKPSAAKAGFDAFSNP